MSIVYSRQKAGREELAKIWKNPDRVNVIHYSCESFYDRNPATSPRVTCIAVRNLQTGQTRSFSLHKCAEIKGAQVQGNLDSFEKQMLQDFFEFVIKKEEYDWVHWNMRDENFGFQALEHRLKVLKGTPGIEVDDAKKFDLSRILIAIYGRGYIDHPRLENLMKKNEISQPNFKSGREEAELYNIKDFVALHQSTLSKVEVLASLCQIAYENKLKTNTTWWDLHCHSLMAVLSWVQSQPIVVALSLIGNLSWIIPLIMRLIQR